jgi:hypothetical protein
MTFSQTSRILVDMATQHFFDCVCHRLAAFRGHRLAPWAADPAPRTALAILTTNVLAPVRRSLRPTLLGDGGKGWLAVFLAARY